MSPVEKQLQDTLDDLGKSPFKRFKRELSIDRPHLGHIPWRKLEDADTCDVVHEMKQKFGLSDAVKITLDALKNIDQNHLAEQLKNKVQEAGYSGTSPAHHEGPASSKDALRQDERQKLKSVLKQRVARLYEGTSAKGSHVNLKEVYTELYMVEGWKGGVSLEHEVRCMEEEYQRCSRDDTPINFSNLFQDVSKVLTIGIAGVGKTVAVQKFVLEWTEGECNQDVDFIFLIPFRELNLIKEEEFSLQELLLYFHPKLKNLKEVGVFDDECRVLFILDGLDELRVSLNFNQKRFSDVTEKARVDVLITNLITGHLLRSSLIWITSRPATADQIPQENIGLVTEVRGFNDVQKEEYFKRRLKDESLVSGVISDLRCSRSLHIMCHIPVFCCMMAVILKHTGCPKVPKTLTEMYTHFLLIQANLKTQKYDKSQEKDTRKLLKSNREVILQLAELAFKQLVEGNVIFYEEDLEECGINVSEPSIYYGVCSEFFLEESVLYQRKVYCFVHLTFQEFLAAFYVFHCYLSKNMTPLQIMKRWSEEVPLHELLCNVVEINLQEQEQSKKGHLDLFLRFLLGISLESNQKLLQGLLNHVEKSAESIKTTVQFIKDQLQTDLPAGRVINLLHCLLEMNDQSLFGDIGEFLKSSKHPETKLNTSHCSAMAYMLQRSEDVLDELDPKKYSASLEGCSRLLPALRNCRRALLACCSLTASSCDGLISALQKVNSPLKELDLTNNDLQDSGVKLLSAALESPHCQLKILRLSGCMITDEGCSFLAQALSSDSSHLRELDLTYNNPGQTGRKLLDDPQCKLEKLDLDHGEKCRIKPGFKKYACHLTLDINSACSHLSLSEGNRKVSWVTELEEHPHHPERSEQLHQVVCVESVRESVRSYWEAEWSGGGATVAVTYGGTGHKDDTNSMFGQNAVSWSVTCTDDRYILAHDGDRTEVPASPSSRVGVYLDWQAGTLAFYSVSSPTVPPSLIHTFHCSFMEPLYAGFGVGLGSSVTLIT